MNTGVVAVVARVRAYRHLTQSVRCNGDWQFVQDRSVAVVLADYRQQSTNMGAVLRVAGDWSGHCVGARDLDDTGRDNGSRSTLLDCWHSVISPDCPLDLRVGYVEVGIAAGSKGIDVDILGVALRPPCNSA